MNGKVPAAPALRLTRGAWTRLAAFMTTPRSTSRPTARLTARRFVSEHMDDPSIPRDELDQALRFIRIVNRRLGGTAAAMRWMRRLVRTWPRDRTLRIVDLGTGSADIPLAVARWAHAEGRAVRIVAVDNHRTTLDLADEHLARQLGNASPLRASIELVEGDARTITDTLVPGDFDVAHAGMFLHHLPDIEILTVMRVMQRLAPTMQIVNDLVRDRLSQFVVRALTLGVPPKVRHDAVVSVDKGFTRGEMLDMAARVGLVSPRWHRHLWGRFTLVSGAPEEGVDR